MWLCTCGFANPDSSQACSACGAARSDGMQAPAPAPAPEQAERIEPACQTEPSSDAAFASGSLMLENARTHETIEVTMPGGILGRAGDFAPDSFSPQVSGVHLIAECTDGTWTLEFVGRNATSINAAGEWVPLVAGMPRTVRGGELLKMADMLFRLSVIPATCDDEAEEPAEDESPAVLVWSVRCPVCGTEHRVDGPDARIKTCSSCVDDLDRRKIKRVLPRQIEVAEA
ncbi:hypothetical protein [Slackia heliotrinireducens]|uniref:hypothetical protein n=1 Tax=Slackia heliotrinireducens TaxID=84110 RepID=UPI003315885B